MAAGTLRLFVAIYPPKDVRQSMLAAVEPPETPHRMTAVDQVHMTIQFIGETREKDLTEVVDSVHRAAAGIAAFPLKPLRLISLPERGAPRLIAVETDAPSGLMELHRRFAMRLARSPRAKASDRFLPHLTVCRFTGSGTPGRLERAMEMREFECGGLRVMRSVLKPDRAEHVLVEEVPLR
jgi:2'-5' RNA ligase